MSNHFKHINVKDGSTEYFRLIDVTIIDSLNTFVVSAKYVVASNIL